MEKIDLNKLTQRELLVITHNKVADLAERFEAIEVSNSAQDVKIAVIETKVKTWGSLWGAISGGVVGIITSIIK